MGKWSFFGHEGARVTFIRLGLVMLLPWGSQLTGRLRAPPGPAETGCNPLPHVRTAISERTIARAAAAIVSAFEAFGLDHSKYGVLALRCRAGAERCQALGSGVLAAAVSAIRSHSAEWQQRKLSAS